MYVCRYSLSHFTFITFIINAKNKRFLSNHTGSDFDFKKVGKQQQEKLFCYQYLNEKFDEFIRRNEKKKTKLIFHFQSMKEEEDKCLATKYLA